MLANSIGLSGQPAGKISPVVRMSVSLSQKGGGRRFPAGPWLPFRRCGPRKCDSAAPPARPDQWELVNTVNLRCQEALGHPCCAVTLIRVWPADSQLDSFAQPSPAPHVSRHRCICALRTPVSRPGIDSIDVLLLFNTQNVNYFN